MVYKKKYNFITYLVQKFTIILNNIGSYIMQKELKMQS
jgi:hypothetical protein